MSEVSDQAPVSVVIPCYCCADTIERAVSSVVRQTLLPKEVILVDDASPDHGQTLRALHDLKKKFDNIFDIRVLTFKKNQGPASARNAGWEAATQPFIAFLDADDSWHPRKLEVQYQWMASRPEIDISGHVCNWEGISQYEEADLNGIIPSVPITKISLLFRNAFSTPSVMLKRSLPLRFAEGKRHAEDYFLWLQAVCMGYRIGRLEVPLAALHKAPYGEAGLSADLWAMEKGELDCYIRLCREGQLGVTEYCVATVWSLLKFSRRVILRKFRH